MSATLVSSNTTIKMNAVVNASATNTSGTLYTAPANGYALVQVSFSGTGSITGSMDIGSATIFSVNASYQVNGLVVGPSQSVTYSGTTTGTIFFAVSGASFVNTP